jgi:hypothetical protein
VARDNLGPDIAPDGILYHDGKGNVFVRDKATGANKYIYTDAAGNIRMRDEPI